MPEGKVEEVERLLDTPARSFPGTVAWHGLATDRIAFDRLALVVAERDADAVKSSEEHVRSELASGLIGLAHNEE